MRCVNLMVYFIIYRNNDELSIFAIASLLVPASNLMNMTKIVLLPNMSNRFIFGCFTVSRCFYAYNKILAS